MTSAQPRVWSLYRTRPLDLAAAFLAVAVAACLAIDAYVHVNDAADYDATRTSLLSQGTLFRIEGAIAISAAIALLASRRRYAWAIAGAVLAAGFSAVVLYTYVNVGKIGPVPNMYEPSWSLPGKTMSAWAEATGALLSVVGMLTSARRRHVTVRTAYPTSE